MCCALGGLQVEGFRKGALSRKSKGTNCLLVWTHRRPWTLSSVAAVRRLVLILWVARYGEKPLDLGEETRFLFCWFFFLPRASLPGSSLGPAPTCASKDQSCRCQRRCTPPPCTRSRWPSCAPSPRTQGRAHPPARVGQSCGIPTLDSLVNISMGPMYSRLSRLSISRWAD